MLIRLSELNRQRHSQSSTVSNYRYILGIANGIMGDFFYDLRFKYPVREKLWRNSFL
jgi:hypothetical protein